MTLQEYQGLAARTCPTLENLEHDNAHMFAGMITEFGELLDIYKKNLAYKKPVDTVNLSEEWADFMWYSVNFARINNIPLILIEDIIQGNVNNAAHAKLHPVQLVLGFNELIWELMAYQDEDHFQVMVSGWYALGEMLSIDTDKALENNIAKLKVRFADKFNEKDALNRDLDEERKQLEN